MNPERFARLRRALERRQPDLTVLMDGVHKSHNFSAILRSCDAAGVLETHVVPAGSGLATHRASSAGTKKYVRVVRHADVGTAAEELSSRGFTLVAAHPSAESVDYRSIDYTRPTALVVGAELDGVSREGLLLADRTVVIPMMGVARSLNVSVAAAVILYEARLQRERAGMYDESRLAPHEFERTLFEWAHPKVAASRRARGRPYPDLTEDGQLVR